MKYPYLTLIGSFALILISIWPLLHNIAYFNGLNFLGALGTLTGALGITLVESSQADTDAHEKEK